MNHESNPAANHEDTQPGFVPHQPQPSHRPHSMPAFMQEPAQTFEQAAPSSEVPKNNPAHTQISDFPPSASPTDLQASANQQPVAVVQTLSVRGVEYTMMTLPLWIAAASLAWLLLSVVNGNTDFSLLSFPAALLIVCVPIFGFFFIRLRRAELAIPALRFDPSKRRLTMFTQIFAYATCLFNLIAYVYMIMQKLSGESEGVSIGKATINLLIIFAIAGGVLAYYWYDEHKNLKDN